jgi:hypothetical protein
MEHAPKVPLLAPHLALGGGSPQPGPQHSRALECERLPLQLFRAIAEGLLRHRAEANDSPDDGLSILHAQTVPEVGDGPVPSYGCGPKLTDAPRPSIDFQRAGLVSKTHNGADARGARQRHSIRVGQISQFGKWARPNMPHPLR